MLFTVIEDIFSCFERGVATWTGYQFVGEESLSIFTNRGMVGDESCDTCT